MATQIIGGPWTWGGLIDEEGYRTYKVVFRVEGEVTDGPANVLRTPGLPLPGTTWQIDDDVDLWVWAYPNAEAKPELEGVPNKYWRVEMTFSNKPLLKRCFDTEIENPLLEPPKISGGGNRYQEEIQFDLFGPIMSSSHELMKGPETEFDKNRQTVRIQMNISELDLPLLTSMIDSVNSTTLWGMPPRTIKMAPFTWERKFYGQCFCYMFVELEFEIKFDGWDRLVVDEGSKVLKGEWQQIDADSEGTGTGTSPSLPENQAFLWRLTPIARDRNGNLVYPDKNNPAHFMRAHDPEGNFVPMVLDGNGKPYNPFPFQYCFLGTEQEASDEATAVGAVEIDGPFDTEEACDFVCFQSNTAAHWCVPGHGCFYGTYAQAQNLIEQGDILGPYETAEACAEACEKEKWWFIVSPNGATDCYFGTRSEVGGLLYAPGTQFFGPFDDIADCQNYASGTGTTHDPIGTGTGTGDLANQPRYWCIKVRSTQPGSRLIVYYPGVNFLLLGIPTELTCV